MKELAELLQSVPGIRSIDLRDVRRLAELLRESPEIGSIEVKGWFGTGVVITRTAAVPMAPMAAAMPMPTAMPAAPAPRPADVPAAEAPRAASALKDIKSPMV